FFKRNPRLFTPKDFDYSPYFDIIKYPFLGLDDLGVYRRLPWGDDSILYNDNERTFAAATKMDGVDFADNESEISKKRKKHEEEQAYPQDDDAAQQIINTMREADR
ncbi:MAG: hypothetical protein AB2805_05155, partial [Candidatus Thiodiazotropha sp.]